MILGNALNSFRPSLWLQHALLTVAMSSIPAAASADSRAADTALAQGAFGKVLAACNESAQQGEPRCQWHLGNLYRFGKGVNLSLEEAVRWFTLASAQGHPAAQENLAQMRRRGQGTTADFAQAFRLMRASADQGYVPAINALGSMHMLGQGTPKDSVKACNYFRRAAESGNGWGQSNFGYCLRDGLGGLAKDESAALALTRKSAEQGNPGGLNQLGTLYRSGRGVILDLYEAQRLFERAADSGEEADAYANLGNLYYPEGGIELDGKKAVAWFEKGAKAGSIVSMANLGKIYRLGEAQIPQDFAKALEWYNKAMQLGGNDISRNGLGTMHRLGQGVEIDLPKARSHYEAAAAMGSADAVFNLGYMHERGQTFKPDTAEAVRLYTEALKSPTLYPGNRKYALSFLAKTSAQVETSKPPESSKPVARMPAASAQPATDLTKVVAAAKPFAEVKTAEVAQVDLVQTLGKIQAQLAALQAAQSTQTSAKAPAVEPKPTLPAVLANRKALVIGNDNYGNVSKLKNAAADANAMAKSLEAVGYRVWTHIDVDEKRFKQALRDFRLQIQGGDEVLVFYAGHGVQLGAANYMLPIDIRGDTEEQVKDEAIQLQRVLDDLQEKKVKFALAVIDACRDNPFKGSGRALGGRGLAPTTAATGQMIVFSAGSGQQALDKLGDNDTNPNGLFTRIFIREMNKPGISVDRVLRNVRNEVVRLAKTVGHEQTPALYDQAVGEFYFRQ